MRGSVASSPPASAGDVGQSLGWDGPLEKEVATRSASLGDPMDGAAWGAIVHGVAEESDTAQ